MKPKKYDRVDTNKTDGQNFYGVDDKESNTTTWYSENNSLDSITKTPSDDEWND